VGVLRSRKSQKEDPGGKRMASLGIRRKSSWKVGFAALVVFALAFGASGVAGAASNGKLKDLGHGVGAKAIKVGIAIIDYDSIADFVDFARGDQQKTAQIFVDYINKNGGVDGRQIDPVYKTYEPIPGRTPDPLALCTSWTEDDGVFAVLGVFIDFSGQGQLCITKEHNTVHIGHELEDKWISQAPPGLLLTPDTTKEIAAKTFVPLLISSGKLKGKTVGFLTDQNAAGRIKDLVVPAMKKAKVKTGSTAVLTITGTDTSAAQAQVDSFIEKWKSEGVDTIYMAGLTASAKQFVEKIKAAMPDLQLVADSSSVAEQAQDEVKAGKTPNPYEGIYSVTGETDNERWANKGPLLQKCVDIYQKATGTTVPAPEDAEVNAKGKTVQLDIAVADFCGELFMFQTIANKVGANLTTKNWQKTVNNFGKIELVPTKIASLCKGKYAADDAFRLVAFDSSMGTDGDWKAVTPIKDTSGGVCTKKAS
jgi:ABC-type branched-subunit amino acid transport system substrate-binding protein